MHAVPGPHARALTRSVLGRAAAVARRRLSGASAGSRKARRLARFPEDLPVAGVPTPPPAPEALAAAQRVFATPRKLDSAARPAELPDFGGAPEVAVVGRSNVGKSSLLNALLGAPTALARASKRPGCTQRLDFYAAGRELVLVDMPGYGFAKAPVKETDRWLRLVLAYLEGRPPEVLRRVMVLVDARRGPREVDLGMFDMLSSRGVPAQAVLTKADAVSATQLKEAALAIGAACEGVAVHPACLVTSASKKHGIRNARAHIVEACGLW